MVIPNAELSTVAIPNAELSTVVISNRGLPNEEFPNTSISSETLRKEACSFYGKAVKNGVYLP